MKIELAQQAADLAAQKFGSTEKDKKAFFLVVEFLEQFPERLSHARGKVPSPDSVDFYIKLADKFFKARQKVDGPKPPETVPDDMVSYILEVYFDFKQQDLDRIKREHLLSMAAENIVGALLERYIGSVLEDHGWVWCSGNFIKAIDMIKKKSDGSWVLLQVKNRDNTENSSSSAIRQGSTITKWFRSFSRKNATNWDIFPDEETRSLLSEEGFKDFVKDYLTKAKILDGNKI
ncbi:MAG: SinI family restriction endonuclease [Gammaproteobacteria bacterium]|nr:SinI family restriction endonuclease [Gammaproteobacteria bacterium]MCW5582947.1 SinI family restriction endonuclease [Gammaproteobacteria bacterium]